MGVIRAGAIAVGTALALAGGCLGAAMAADADAAASLTGVPGRVAEGRAVVLARDRGNCGACHRLPGLADTAESTMGPSLDGLADRLGEDQIRARIIDARRLNPGTIMPSYHRVDGLNRVAKALRDKPVLSAQEVEDVVAYMMTLRDRKDTR